MPSDVNVNLVNTLKGRFLPRHTHADRTSNQLETALRREDHGGLAELQRVQPSPRIGGQLGNGDLRVVDDGEDGDIVTTES